MIIKAKVESLMLCRLNLSASKLVRLSDADDVLIPMLKEVELRIELMGIKLPSGDTIEG